MYVRKRCPTIRRIHRRSRPRSSTRDSLSFSFFFFFSFFFSYREPNERTNERTHARTHVGRAPRRLENSSTLFLSPSRGLRSPSSRVRTNRHRVPFFTVTIHALARETTHRHRHHLPAEEGEICVYARPRAVLCVCVVMKKLERETREAKRTKKLARHREKEEE